MITQSAQVVNPLLCSDGKALSPNRRIRDTWRAELNQLSLAKLQCRRPDQTALKHTPLCLPKARPEPQARVWAMRAIWSPAGHPGRHSPLLNLCSQCPQMPPLKVQLKGPPHLAFCLSPHSTSSHFLGTASLEKAVSTAEGVSLGRPGGRWAGPIHLVPVHRL